MSAETPIHRFAWPFDGPSYRYFTNVEHAGVAATTAAGSWGEGVFHVDQTYADVVAERRTILARDPRRVGSLPHMAAAEWDAAAWILERFASENPDIATTDLTDPERLRFCNTVTGTKLDLAYGDPEVAPLTTAAAEVVEDLFLLDTRDGALRLESFAATFTGSWSSSFSLGMTFTDLHGPVPRVHGTGMVARTERFIRALSPGDVVRRLNWSMYETGELDASLESAHGRAPRAELQTRLCAEPGALRMRIEIQHLTALPRTGAILFLITTQLAPLSQLAAVPQWRAQLLSVLAELPEDLAAYKNFADLRTPILEWLVSIESASA
ncbi:hypothetical protein BVC93_27295 [Mycobacterium sp. MS1601]|uniref:heme-dependent oxidative N-demethylase family protein n=1 Tax=Mycobacterium sp. MS1601 TaxID=1936029 RepID=UPI0009796667|nr:DUF3445 domain-containing protein [Mycobacterium sp. MS1601]AQA05467.1 hypothetical protein BVC93_27295 [Mycobacterium sp. MS1601]